MRPAARASTATPTNPNNNAIVNPFFNTAFGFNSTRDTYRSIFLKPSNSSTNQTKKNLEPVSGTFIESNTFKGAIDPSPSVAPWTKGWSVGSSLGYFVE